MESDEDGQEAGEMQVDPATRAMETLADRIPPFIC